MARSKTVFRCTECGGAAPKWVGRSAPAGSGTRSSRSSTTPTRASAAWPWRRPDGPVPIAEVDADEWQPRPTGLAEVDRVLGGGFVPGSVTLLGGEPGIGKSTLLLQVVAALAAPGRDRALRLGRGVQAAGAAAGRAAGHAAARTCGWPPRRRCPHLVAHLDEVRPDVLVVDSIQTVYDPELSSAPGSVAQVRECAARLVREAKARGVAIVLVGHVTKDGGLAGPRVLEHVVDTVLAFEGDRHHAPAPAAGGRSTGSGPPTSSACSR